MRFVSCFAVFALALIACQSAPTPGASCASTADCTSPLVCRLGRCRSECAANRDCPTGAVCLLDAMHVGSCSVDTDTRCESGGHTCPTGLVCVGDRCANTCTTNADCPSDGVCSMAATTGVQFCFAPGRDDAGVPGDAGVPVDANVDDAQPPADSGADTGTGGGTDSGPPIDGGACTGASCGTATAMCATEYGMCVIRDDRSVLCWGTQYALADGFAVTTRRTHETCATGGWDCSASPVVALTESGVRISADEIACGEFSVCARDGARVYCWGGNDDGELGDGGALMPEAHRAVEVTSSLVSGHASHLYAGGRGFCIESTSGGYVCWGRSAEGTFGTTTAVLPPTAVSVISSAPAMGDDHVCWATGGAGVSCMGTDASGQLGPHGPTGSVMGSSTPVALDAFGASVSQVLSNGSGSCALLANNELWCWGVGLCGEIGVESSVTPNRVGTFSTVWLSPLSSVGCGRDLAGHMSCWGTLGCTMPTTGTPMPQPALESATHVVSAHAHWCFIDASGTVQCAGSDTFGQIARRPIVDAVFSTFAPVCISSTCVP